MSEDWINKIVSIPYWLGEICIFRKNFKLQVLDVDFLKHKPEDPSLLKPYSRNEAIDTEGYMLHSVPFDKDRPDFWYDDEGYINYITKFYNRYYIDLGLSYEQYLLGFSSKTRSTLRRKIRKFEKLSQGNIDWRRYSTPEEMSEFYKLAREISKDTYQEKHLDVGLPTKKEFYENMLKKAENSTVRGYILFMDSKPVSYLYTPLENDRYVYEYLGYLPEISRYSPGIVLQFKVLEFLFGCDEAKVFDFTEGQSDQKKLFSTDHIYCGNLICLKYSWKNYFWLNLNRLTNKLSNILGDFLDRLGLKKRIKQFLRR